MRYFLIFFLIICFPAFAGNPGMLPVGTFTLNDCLKSAGGIGVQDAGAPCVSASSVVSSFSAGTTGFTPSSPTVGAVVLGGILAVASGGTGTASPGLVQGTNITITGSWPNQTINATSSGTVSTVSVVTANGVSGSVANPTTTPAITLTLGAITPSSVNGVTISNSNTPTWTIGSASGVPVVTASAPLVITGATGNITCPTCDVGNITLGTSASATNPQRSGDATTGLYSSAAATVGISASGTNIITIGTTGLKIPALTSQSIPYIGTGGLVSQDNAEFYWQDSTQTLSIGDYFNQFATINVNGYYALGNFPIDSDLGSVSLGDTGVNLAAINAGAYDNLAIGPFALNNLNLGGGFQNVAIGIASLEYAQTANNDIGIGYYAGNGMASEQYSIAIGAFALQNSNSGLGNNLAVGAGAMLDNSSGGNNMAIGGSALEDIQTGNNNMALGATSCKDVTSGSGNICIGANVDTPLGTNVSNTMNIGNAIYAVGLGSSSLQVGIGSTIPKGGLDVQNGPVRLKGYTVSTLPSGTVGMLAYVTDAVACTFLGALAGSGSVVCPVFYNGSAWVGG